MQSVGNKKKIQVALVCLNVNNSEKRGTTFFSKIINIILFLCSVNFVIHLRPFPMFFLT